MSAVESSDRPLVLLGAGGHAKVLLELAQASGFKVVGVCDPGLFARGERQWRGLPVLGDDEALQSMPPGDAGLINGLGQLVGSAARGRLYTRMRAAGFRFPALVHPRAWVAGSSRLADGVQVMAGATVQPDCTVGENSIINTGASLDHDCVVGAHVHVAPGATVCGGVRIEDGAFIGAGSVVLQGLQVGAAAVVGAGLTLTRNLPAGVTRIGAASRIRGDAPPSETEK